ncbi:hypothetical protein Bca101_011303 [Brassica carinata]
MQTEILARLPLKTISRFKSVCKTWKSTLESAYFRHLFLSLHRNSSSSSSSWSLLHGADELIAFHGCKTWGLPKSPASLIPHPFKRYLCGDCDYVDSSGGLVLLSDGGDESYCYVGNPVSQQWVKIPPPPPSDPTGDDADVFGLVTRLDDDGVVLSFKVIRLVSVQWTNNDYLLGVLLYSSETGIWTSKVVHCPHQITNMYYINLNGTVYFTCLSEPGVLAAHDFYSESDQFRVVQLPDYPDYSKDYKRTLTMSGGFVVYVRSQAKKDETVLKIWRLDNDDDTWQLLWEQWVSCNLWKRDYTILGHQDCFIDESVCKKSVDEIWDPRSLLDFRVCIWFCPFVMPRWMKPVPRPPQAEMIDTTSLLSYATAIH